jgi:hydrogenase maturation factor
MKRTMMLFVVMAALVATVPAVPAYAHHSFAATYHEDQTEKVEGDLVEFLFRNPHSFVQLEGKDGKGVTQRYAIEWAGGVQLNRQGVSRDSLKAGDHVIITGNPGRNAADHRLRMRSIERPADGWKWSGTFD